MNYSSFADAKIAHPDEDIYSRDGKYQIGSAPCKLGEMWNKCNPADHCKTLGWLRDNHGAEFAGDIILGHVSRKVIQITQDVIKDYDDNCLILRAAALNKPKRVKVSYVKCEDSIFDLRADFEAGELFVKIGENYEVALSSQCLAASLAVGSCYRKVETEIDERQEFIDFTSEYIKNLNPEILKSFEYIARAMFDSGKFKLVNDK